MVVFFQSAFFTILAVLIMRLKLLMTPQLCILSSLFIYFILKTKSKISKLVHLSLIIIIFSLIAQVSYENVQRQLKIQGEYSNIEMESLMKWIQTNTNLNSSFAGSMSTMANVKLSTNRIIINHPHYEDYSLRLKTYKLYRHIYGRYSLKELHFLLKNEYKVNYLIIESYYCLGYSPQRPECSMKNIVHVKNELKERNRQKHACDSLLTDESEFFKKVYQQGYIIILKIND
jgi:C-mannosyltransferase DPY19L